MWDVAHSSPGMLGEAPRPVRGVTLNSADIVLRLSQLVPGIHADPGGRLGFWHPDVQIKQGLYYYHKHICSMDRGNMPQWPEWETEEGLAEVPLDYAIAHSDFPVLSLKPDGSSSMHESDTAFVMRPMLSEIKCIGWAEVFWRVLKAGIPGLTPAIIAATFRVPMDWYGQLKASPLSESYQQAKSRGFAE
jgi:hypothetical protein